MTSESRPTPPRVRRKCSVHECAGTGAYRCVLCDAVLCVTHSERWLAFHVCAACAIAIRKSLTHAALWTLWSEMCFEFIVSAKAVIVERALAMSASTNEEESDT